MSDRTRKRPAPRCVSSKVTGKDVPIAIGPILPALEMPRYRAQPVSSVVAALFDDAVHAVKREHYSAGQHDHSATQVPGGESLHHWNAACVCSAQHFGDFGGAAGKHHHVRDRMNETELTTAVSAGHVRGDVHMFSTHDVRECRSDARCPMRVS